MRTGTNAGAAGYFSGALGHKQLTAVPESAGPSSRAESGDGGATPCADQAAASTAPDVAEPAATRTGAGLASDVWSFGCLVYELVAGRQLFAGADYASITHRVAFGGGARLTLTPGELTALGGSDVGGHGLGQQVVGPLVQALLVRDPAKRPWWPAVSELLGAALKEVLAVVTSSTATLAVG
jgi:serine/threonine protein kinase